MSRAAEVFLDRRDAGRVLAHALATYANHPDLLVLALPRGGVPVAFEVAEALHAALDVFVVRKLGVPGHEEFAMGAIASGGVRVLNDEIVRHARVSPAEIEAVTRAEQRELERRERLYRQQGTPLRVQGRTVILVDDGLATGSTMLAAVKALKTRLPQRIVVAVPTGSPQTCQALRGEADDVVCARSPEPFVAVGSWYRDFSQTSDDEVQALLARHLATHPT
jgi:putative phosphoribosyl transferase